MAEPNKALKSLNNPLLVAAVAANIVVYQVVAQGDAIIAGDLWSAAKGAATLVPAALTAIVAGVLNAQIDPTMKARIVFWRWRDPLPGSEAFTRHAASDARIDAAALALKFGPLPTTPSEQNSLWYRLYKTVDKDESVSHIHKEFLFTRDYAVLSLFMLVGLGALAIYHMPWATALLYLAAMVGQYLLVRRAARTHGHRFVTTVLALKGAGK